MLCCETLALDPLDWWARSGRPSRLTCDLQTRLDLAHDYARAGLYAEAIAILDDAATVTVRLRTTRRRRKNSGCRLKVWAPRRWSITRSAGCTNGRATTKSSQACYERAAALPPDYCFPARLEEIAVLKPPCAPIPKDARAPVLPGQSALRPPPPRRRHGDCGNGARSSIRHFSVVWRNLGIGYFNVRKQPAKARAAYDRAFRANPTERRLLFERDQLWKRLGESPAKRLRELEKHLDLVRQRDDLSVELCALYNQTGRHEKRSTHLAAASSSPGKAAKARRSASTCAAASRLGARRSATGDAAARARHFEAALTSPRNLGEAKHLLANQSDIHYWLGRRWPHSAKGRGPRALARRPQRSRAIFRR